MFCEKLSIYIDRCGKTELQLAKSCGFARSYIALIRTGKRIPPRQKLDVLIAVLELSLAEKYELWKQWESEKYGETHTMGIDSFAEILYMFQSFSSEITLKHMHNVKFANVEFEKIIYGYENIKWAVSKIIADEAVTKEKRVVLEDQKSDLIVSAISNKPYINITIDHIVCLENCQKKPYNQIRNMAVLKDCMTASMLCKHYNPMYYYGSGHTLASSGLPITIAASTAVLQLTRNKNTALLHNDPETVKLFGYLHDKKSEECSCLWEELSYKEAMEKCPTIYEVTDPIYLFGEQAFLEISGDSAPWAPNVKIKQKTVVYFSSIGLKRWLNDEKMKFSDGRKRAVIIHMLLQSIQEGYCEAHCIDSKYLPAPKGLIVTAAEGKPIAIRHEVFRKYYKINENSLSGIIWTILARLRDSIYVFNDNDTEKLIWELYQPYHDKYL